MKIACLGNMNNVMFQIGRYLLDEKHEVTFFLFDEFDHFLPEADAYDDVTKYKITSLGWNHEQYFKYSGSEIRKAIIGYDFYIGTDLAPAFLFKAGMRLDVYFPHGNDLYDYPFPKYRNVPPQLWEIIPYIVGKAQFKGIKESAVISLDPSEEVYEKACKVIRDKNSKRISAPPFLYLPQYEDDFQKHTDVYKSFFKIRNEFKLIIFQHGSQDWSNRGPYKINKGNDVLLKAFAEYLKKENNKSDSVLILVEYGEDVNKSKNFIKELNIEKNVIWLPKMQRKNIMAAISMSDICVGELGYRNWFSYSCIYEFMAMRKPLIHNRNDAYYKEKGMELYPMIDAKDVLTVEQAFIDFRINTERYRNMGIQAYDWLTKRTKSCLKEFYNVIKEKEKGKLGSNIIDNIVWKKISFYLRPDIAGSYIFITYYKWKLAIKNHK